MSQSIEFYMDEHIANASFEGCAIAASASCRSRIPGMYGCADHEHLHEANSRSSVLFTQDADFLRLHANGQEHSGIVYAPQGTSIGEMIRVLMLIWEVLEPAEMDRHVEFL